MPQVRHSSLALSVLLLVVTALRYKDYTLLNNSLLEDIRRQNMEMRRTMEDLQVGLLWAEDRSLSGKAGS